MLFLNFINYFKQKSMNFKKHLQLQNLFIYFPHIKKLESSEKLNYIIICLSLRTYGFKINKIIVF